MLSRYVLVVFIGFFYLGLNAQTEKAKEVTAVLCSDSLFGRGYVNNGVNKAAAYLISEFEQSGLKPFFGDEYFQTFDFNVNTFPGKMKVMINEKELEPGKDFVVDHNSGGFTGELNFTYIDTTYLKEPSVKTTVMADIGTGAANAVFVDTRGATVSQEAELAYNLRELAKLVPVVMTTGQKFIWGVGRKQLNNPVVFIKEGVIKDEKEMNVELDIEALYVTNFECMNVAGHIPSKKNPEAKTIVFTAHYDHLGGMGNETYFPGANDNASGTAMLISLADYFRENPIEDYHLVFVAFAGEEAGLVGSKHFVGINSLPPRNIEFLINLDIMGSGEEGITAVNGLIHKKKFKMLKKINKKGDYLPQIKARGETANSDHYPFHQKDVPCFFIYTMGPNKNYHDIYDKQEELSFAAYDEIVHLIADFVEKL
ncbi:MAG: M28 family peptidase [Brumimicrobium sp.]|nr:M28 family peptidase [Brumimicrobium sp.]